MDFIGRGSGLIRQEEHLRCWHCAVLLTRVSNDSSYLCMLIALRYSSVVFFFCLYANQVRGKRKRCLRVRRPAACQSCLRQYFKVAPKMNTQIAAVYHQSSARHPPYVCMAALCDSIHCGAACGSQWCYTKQPYSFSSLHASLEMRITITKA